MIKNDVVTDLFLAVVDSWTEYHRGETINPELCDIIEQHLNYAYAAGFDELSRKLVVLLDEHIREKYNYQISAKYVKEQIDTHEINNPNPRNR